MKPLNFLIKKQNKIFFALIIFGILYASLSIPYANASYDAQGPAFIVLEGLTFVFFGSLALGSSLLIEHFYKKKPTNSIPARLFRLFPLSIILWPIAIIIQAQFAS